MSKLDKELKQVQLELMKQELKERQFKLKVEEDRFTQEILSRQIKVTSTDPSPKGWKWDYANQPSAIINCKETPL